MLRHVVFIFGMLTCATWAQAAAPGAFLSPVESRPLRVLQTVTPTFPRSLLDQGVMKGHARVVIDVDEAGLLADWLVVSHSRPEFGEAAIRAIRSWAFEPMMLRGHTVASQVMIGFEYEARGVVIDIHPGTNPTAFLVTGFGEQGYRPRSERELDRIPFLLNPVEPTYSSVLQQTGVAGSATVEFYIDETGAVRMPTVISADFPELGDLAVAAVRQWNFEPPTSRGKPVLAHVRQRFDFGPSRK